METWGKQERKYGLIEKLFIANKRWPISVLRSFAVFESSLNEVKLAPYKRGMRSEYQWPPDQTHPIVIAVEDGLVKALPIGFLQITEYTSFDIHFLT